MGLPGEVRMSSTTAVHTGDPRVMARDLRGVTDKHLQHLRAAIDAELNRRTLEYIRRENKR